jgi:hypothetical protein
MRRGLVVKYQQLVGKNMEINLGEERIIELLSPFSAEDVQARAIAKRIDAFSQLTPFMQSPKPDDIVITQSEKRLRPFWYGAAHAHYKYGRRHRYNVEVAPEVQSVKFNDHDYAVIQEQRRFFTLEGVEQYVEDNRRELMLDPQHGEERDYAHYLQFPRNPVSDLEALRASGAVLTMPEVRSSFVVRRLLQLLMKSLQADKIFEERIDIEEITLYYRPAYAFEFYWQASDLRAVVELDGLTGVWRADGGQMTKEVVNVLGNDALFDIGSDAVGMVLPGANIAVKLGRLTARKEIVAGGGSMNGLRQRPRLQSATTLAYPKLMSKRFASVFIVKIHPHGSRKAEREIQDAAEKYGLTAVTHDSPVVEHQTVMIKLSSPQIEFSDPGAVVVSNEVKTVSFTGMPRDTCQPGKHAAVLSITDKENEVLMQSIPFEVEIVDFAFDHLSRPLLSNMVSALLVLGSLASFVLSFLGEIDKTFGLASGTAAGTAALFLYLRFLNLFQRPNTNVSAPP